MNKNTRFNVASGMYLSSIWLHPSILHWKALREHTVKTEQSVKGFPCGTSGKEPTCQYRRHKRQGFDPWVGKVPWRRAWQPTPIFLPGESHRQKSLESYSPKGSRVRHNWSNSAHTKYYEGKVSNFCWKDKNRIFILSLPATEHSFC